MTAPLSPDARARLDQHLEAVEDALRAAGRTRDQRRAIVDDLETQILDMLGNSSDREAVESVLARLDRPDAYAPGNAPPAPSLPAAPPVTPPPHAAPVMPPQLHPKRRSLLKPAVLISLIICGTLLILTPHIVDQLNAQRVANVLAQRTDMTSITLNAGNMGGTDRFACWFTGTVAIALGAIGGFIAFYFDRKDATDAL